MNRESKFLQMDERSKLVGYKVVAFMYFMNVFALLGIVLYRQLVMGQDMKNFEDVALLLTVTSIFLFSFLLYFGAITIRRFKLKTILLGFVIMLVLGILFVVIKYSIKANALVTLTFVLGKIYIMASILGLMFGFWALMAFLGKKKMEKEIE